MNSRPLSVCMVNAQLHLGGAETVMHQAAAGLRGDGHHVGYVVSTLGKNHPRPPGVRLLYPRFLDQLRYTRFSGLVERFLPARKFQERAFRRLADESGQLFHLHSFSGYASIPALVGLAASQPVLWTLHCYWGDARTVDGRGTPHEAAWGLAPQLLRTPRNLAELEALSRELQPLLDLPLWAALPSRASYKTAQSLPALSRWRLFHVPNGVDAGVFRPDMNGDPARLAQWGLEPDKPVILVVNRDFRIADKGFPMIRKALEIVTPNDDWQILLVGGNAAWAAAQLPPSLHVQARDFVADRAAMVSLYELAEIFLFASVRETFPCVILEAMAAGCCVVATPTDGVVEQITDGTHGLLAEEIGGQALAASLRHALGEPELRRRLAAGARARVETEFSEAAMVAGYLKIYREMQERS